jgi:hypothetical protein
MTHGKPASRPDLLAGVVLRDESGRYYAIPRVDLARFRVADRHGAQVGALLRGEDVADAPDPAGGPLAGDADEGPPAGTQPAIFGWRFRTSRRSDALWLDFA